MTTRLKARRMTPPSLSRPDRLPPIHSEHSSGAFVAFYIFGGLTYPTSPSPSSIKDSACFERAALYRDVPFGAPLFALLRTEHNQRYCF